MSEMKRIHNDIPSQFYVLSDGNNYELEWLDSRLAKHVKSIDKQDYVEYLNGKRSGGDLMTKAAYGVWPAPKEVQDSAEKKFIESAPTSLIDVEDSRKYFTKDELRKLIPIAEKQWIDWKGKLPDDYHRPY